MRQAVPARSKRRSFAGAWIETRMMFAAPFRSACRSFAGAWIETLCSIGSVRGWRVAPLQERGLKLDYYPPNNNRYCVAPLQERGLKRSRARDIRQNWQSLLCRSVD